MSWLVFKFRTTQSINTITSLNRRQAVLRKHNREKAKSSPKKGQNKEKVIKNSVVPEMIARLQD